MDTTTYIRHIRRDPEVDSYIQLGIVYTLACVAKYWDVYRRQNKFGPLLDLDDIQEEVVETLVRVARYFRRLPVGKQVNARGESTFQFYLGKAIRLHILRLARRYWPDNAVRSLEELLDELDDQETQGPAVKQVALLQRHDRDILQVEDVAIQTEESLNVDDFLRHLTERQRNILLYRLENIGASDAEVAGVVGCSRPTVTREMWAIKKRAQAYAHEYMPEWVIAIQRWVK